MAFRRSVSRTDTVSGVKGPPPASRETRLQEAHYQEPIPIRLTRSAAVIGPPVASVRMKPSHSPQ